MTVRLTHIGSPTALIEVEWRLLTGPTFALPGRCYTSTGAPAPKLTDPAITPPTGSALAATRQQACPRVALRLTTGWWWRSSRGNKPPKTTAAWSSTGSAAGIGASQRAKPSAAAVGDAPRRDVISEASLLAAKNASFPRG